jgi:hypothetical protein
MSSEISTKRVAAPDQTSSPKPQTLEAWQFFVLAALGCATAATFMARGQGITSVVLISLLMAGAAVVGLAALRTVRPLLSGDDDRTVMVGHRTRAALEREKLLTLRAIKELEFDRAMGKLSESDWNEMSGRLRARATRLMRQLDAGTGYREQIERDVARKMGESAARDAALDAARDHIAPAPAAGRTCAACSGSNDADARFCKNCGARL